MNDQPSARTRRAAPAGDLSGMVLAGRYEVQRQVARGGMATVYLARDTVLNRLVAVKLLSDETDAGEADAFLHEARAVAQISHPNIVEVYDAGVEGSLRYIVMQYVRGGSLREQIARDAPLDVMRAVEIAIRLADALDAAHERGIVHCDVKPGNVLMAENGQPKLVDFGIALGLAGAAPDSDIVAGTAAYIAPEQLAGGRIDGRADEYALAVLLYEMITGRPPYAGGSLAAVAARQHAGPPPPMRDSNPLVSPELDAIVARALERDPTRRFPSAHDFAEALRGFRSSWLESQTQRLPRAHDRGTERITIAHRAVLGSAEATATQPSSPPWAFIIIAGVLIAALTAMGVLLAARMVDLSAVSLGPPQQSTVPAATGDRLDSAARRIQAAGLVVATVTFRPDQAPLGTVIAQDPAPSTTLRRGSAVNLIVSLGQEQP